MYLNSRLSQYPQVIMATLCSFMRMLIVLRWVYKCGLIKTSMSKIALKYQIFIKLHHSDKVVQEK